MEGGTGDDILVSDGFSGDTYLFNTGDGKDTIKDFGATPAMGYSGPRFDDTIRFGAGISAASVSLARKGNDMIFRVSATDQITVKDWYKDNYHYIEQVQFADGTSWDLAQIRNMPADTRANAAVATGHRNRSSLSADAIDARFSGAPLFGEAGGSLRLSLGAFGNQLPGSDGCPPASERPDEFAGTKGMQLLANQVDAFVSAMAAFAPESAGQCGFHAPEQRSAPLLFAAH